MKIFVLKPLVVEKLSMFSGMYYDALMHLKAQTVILKSFFTLENCNAVWCETKVDYIKPGVCCRMTMSVQLEWFPHRIGQILVHLFTLYLSWYKQWGRGINSMKKWKVLSSPLTGYLLFIIVQFVQLGNSRWSFYNNSTFTRKDTNYKERFQMVICCLSRILAFIIFSTYVTYVPIFPIYIFWHWLQKVYLPETPTRNFWTSCF